MNKYTQPEDAIKVTPPKASIVKSLLKALGVKGG